MRGRELEKQSKETKMTGKDEGLDRDTETPGDR